MHGSPECESSSAERQRQLDAYLPADVALDELLQRFGSLAAFSRYPPIQFLGDFLGSIARPSFDWIENDDAQRLFVLAGEKIFDDRAGVGVCFCNARNVCVRQFLSLLRIEKSIPSTCP
jgi:hypothetical protein